MGTAADRARIVLRVIADLSPTVQQANKGDTIPLDWFRWLPAKAAHLVQPRVFPEDPGGEILQEPVSIERKLGAQLAAIQQVRGGSALRVGWLFVAGRTKVGGESRRVFRPLVTVAASVQRPKGSLQAFIVGMGDPQLTNEVTDRIARARLESEIATGGGALVSVEDVAIPGMLLSRLDQLNSFALRAAAAAGYHVSRVVPAGASPTAAMRSEGLVVLAGAAVYSSVEETMVSSATDWPQDRLDTRTAFHALYVDDEPEPTDDRNDTVVATAAVLSPAQRDAVTRTRRETIVVVSGAPGTGKSHTITAMAGDAISRGESVLVAAKTDSTVDALIDLLQRVPGPDPIVFGSSDRRDALAEKLSAGQLRAQAGSVVRDAAEHRRRTGEEAAALRAAVADNLRLEALADSGAVFAGSRAVAPGLFDETTDLDDLDEVARRATGSSSGWFAGRRRARARRRLVAAARAQPHTDVALLVEAHRDAQDWRRIRAMELQGGLDLAHQWDELIAAESAAREATGRWLAVASHSEDRLDRKNLATVSALATALRSGRSARRAQLASFADDRLSHALPLWIGTLPDIDDLLPPVPALFDLVILDESSSIEQRMAVPALLRARRAAIVGDPRQLRHVSFIGDEEIRTAIHNAGLDQEPTLAAKLDVRRNSIFDVAAGVSVVTMLDEHFRSDPHLIDFIGRNLYLDQFTVATRSPSTQSRDCVDVIRLSGHRDPKSVVTAEVQCIVTELKKCLRDKLRSVGVVTPFRSQADAIEAAVLTAFSADELESLDLRVGTVHSFQGNERDVIFCSLGIGANDESSPWSFVNDSHLLAVFLTRARRRLVFVHSADPPTGSLLAGYLAAVDRPPGPPVRSRAASCWASSIIDDLERQGVVLYRNYPVGRYRLDAAASCDGCNTALIFDVHEDGPDAHIERHMALTQAGWQVIESLGSRWSDRQAELALDLLARLRR